MNVRELIELLSGCEPDAEVVIPDSSAPCGAFAAVRSLQTGWAYNSQVAADEMGFWIDGLNYAEPPRGSYIIRGVRLLGPRCGSVLTIQ